MPMHAPSPKGGRGVYTCSNGKNLKSGEVLIRNF